MCDVRTAETGDGGRALKGQAAWVRCTWWSGDCLPHSGVGFGEVDGRADVGRTDGPLGARVGDPFAVGLNVTGFCVGERALTGLFVGRFVGRDDGREVGREVG